MIRKELQRVDKQAMKSLKQKDVLFIFPQASKRNKTMLVLKKTKTESSIHKVFLPSTVARLLESWKREQERTKEALGREYTDYNREHPYQSALFSFMSNRVILCSIFCLIYDVQKQGCISCKNV